jgi:hypothetical protein
MGALAVLTGVAAASLTTASKTVTVAPEADGSTSARCPSGSEVVSGGFSAPGFDPTATTGPAILLFASHRDGDRNWDVAGHNFHQSTPSPAATEPGSGQLAAYAYCDKHDPKLVVRSKSTTVQALSIGSVEVDCPTGTEAVSGGFSSPAGGPLGTNFPYTSKRASPGSWKVSAYNPSGMPRKLTALATCDKAKPGLETRSQHATVGPNKKVTLDVSCPKGAEAVSGGYASTAEISSESIDAAISFTSKRTSASAWRVSAAGTVSNTTTTPATLTAFVYCRR